MKHNMGKADRIIRFIVAVGLLYLILTKAVSGVLAMVLGILAIMLLATSAFGYCPPYSMLGIKTCKCEDHEEKPATSS